MRNTLLTRILLLAVVFDVPIKSIFAEEQLIDKSVIIDLQQAETSDEIEQAIAQLGKHRRDIISSLIKMLRQETNKHRKFLACYMLGEYSAKQAISFLANPKIMILKDEEFGTRTIHELPRWGRYPAQDTLIKIGHQSIPYMLINIESSDDELIQKLSIEVIREIMGARLSRQEGKDFARIIIEKRMENESDSKKKSRLEASLKFL